MKCLLQSLLSLHGRKGIPANYIYMRTNQPLLNCALIYGEVLSNGIDRRYAAKP